MAKIKLEASDGVIIEIDESAANMSALLQNMPALFKVTSDPIPINEVDSVTLRDVFEYCEKHTQPAADFKALGEEFKKSIESFQKLFKLINASDYLNIPVVLELTIQKAVEMMKDLTLDEVRKVFELTNDFTAEEEANLRQRFGWAFQ